MGTCPKMCMGHRTTPAGHTNMPKHVYGSEHHHCQLHMGTCPNMFSGFQLYKRTRPNMFTGHNNTPAGHGNMPKDVYGS